MNVVLVNLDSLRRDHVGAYGNAWIETPNLDTLAKESLRFTRPYPESIPTICARRSVYTGIRTWPFRGWILQKGETFFPAGWQRMPKNQTSITEVLAENGYDTALITDTYHRLKPSMNFHRGYDVFDYLRGQERDRYKAMKTIPEEEVNRYTVSGYWSYVGRTWTWRPGRCACSGRSPTRKTALSSRRPRAPRAADASSSPARPSRPSSDTARPRTPAG